MAVEPSVPVRTRFSGRVAFVVLCAVGIVVFLSALLPGAFDLKRNERSFVVSEHVERLVFDADGTTKLHISPSRDGRVHVYRESAISKDSTLIEHKRVEGRTLELGSSCTGSRFGVLRSCEFDYELQLPRDVSLAVRIHFGRAEIRGMRGPIDFHGDAGDFEASGCNKRASISLDYGKIELHESCKPDLVRARTRLADIELIVPAGRYDVNVDSRWGDGTERPFANVIEDPLSPHRLDIDVSWAGSVRIEGVRR